MTPALPHMSDAETILHLSSQSVYHSGRLRKPNEVRSPLASSTIWIAFTLLFCILVLATERLGRPKWEWGFKPLASLGFIGFAFHNGACDHPLGLWVVGGLILSFLGDVFLISNRPALFLGGLGSFLLAHVAYIGAFLHIELNLQSVLGGLVVLTPISIAVGRWLLRSVPGDMRPAVIGYIIVITCMVAAALGVLDADKGLELCIGAVLFFISDLSVAIHRFKSPDWVHRAWGLPTYYVAQLFFAYGAGFSY